MINSSKIANWLKSGEYLDLPVPDTVQQTAAAFAAGRLVLFYVKYRVLHYFCTFAK